MLFLQCQQPLPSPSPSASAPPFRPRVSVAAPLSVRVTGGRRAQAVVAMASADARLAGIASSIRVIPDFPKPGGLVHTPPLPYPPYTSLFPLDRSRGWMCCWMSAESIRSVSFVFGISEFALTILHKLASLLIFLLKL